MRILRPILALFLCLAGVNVSAQTVRPSVAATTDAATNYTPSRDHYVFAPDQQLARLDKVFQTPAGYQRVTASAGSFGEWMRGLPLRTDRSYVLSYKGKRLSSPSAAIVAIDVGTKNLQQCADSAIRLHAEYLWANGRTSKLAYHFTSGDEVTFDKWVAGERIAVDGSRVKRRKGKRRSADHASMRRWLDLVFMYAGTRSLHRDSKSVAPSDVQPGDFFVAPGSPGHAVMVLDVAVSKSGKRVALLGQGFMPAQDFHVIRGSSRRTIDNVWFVLPDEPEDLLHTPSWQPFRGQDLRRFGP